MREEAEEVGGSVSREEVLKKIGDNLTGDLDVRCVTCEATSVGGCSR